MLVLTRKSGQTLRLQLGAMGQAEIKIVQVAGGRVSLGIEASPAVRILRGELAERPIPGPNVSGPDVSSSKAA